MKDYKTFMEWYSWFTPLYKMIPFTKNRSVSWITPKHYEKERSVATLKIHSCQHFQAISKLLRVFSNRTWYNHYYSLAEYKEGIPHQDLRDMVQRKMFNKEWFSDYYNKMIGYDFVIDIDIPIHEQIQIAYDSACVVRDFYDKLNVPYELRFSGRGFHFLTPHKFMPKRSFNHLDEDNIYRFYRNIAKYLNSKFAESIDIGIYDHRRVIKIPFSLSIYKDEIYACLPFQDKEQFEKFDLKDYRVDDVLFFNNKWDIKNLKSTLFNKEGNIKKLLKEME